MTAVLFSPVWRRLAQDWCATRDAAVVSETQPRVADAAAPTAGGNPRRGGLAPEPVVAGPPSDPGSGAPTTTGAVPETAKGCGRAGASAAVGADAPACGTAT